MEIGLCFSSEISSSVIKVWLKCANVIFADETKLRILGMLWISLGWIYSWAFVMLCSFKTRHYVFVWQNNCVVLVKLLYCCCYYVASNFGLEFAGIIVLGQTWWGCA